MTFALGPRPGRMPGFGPAGAREGPAELVIVNASTGDSLGDGKTKNIDFPFKCQVVWQNQAGLAKHRLSVVNN